MTQPLTDAGLDALVRDAEILSEHIDSPTSLLDVLRDVPVVVAMLREERAAVASHARDLAALRERLAIAEARTAVPPERT